MRLCVRKTARTSLTRTGKKSEKSNLPEMDTTGAFLFTKRDIDSQQWRLILTGQLFMELRIVSSFRDWTLEGNYFGLHDLTCDRVGYVCIYAFPATISFNVLWIQQLIVLQT